MFGINPNASTKDLLTNMIELKSLSFNEGSYIINQDIMVDSSKTYTLFVKKDFMSNKMSIQQMGLKTD